MRIALVMGHTLKGTGSGSISGIWNESQLTRKVGAEMIQYNSDNKDKLRHEYDIIATDMSSDYITAQASHLNTVGYDYALQIHFNCFTDKVANGTEILEWNVSNLGKALSDYVSCYLDTKNRGSKQRQDLKFLRLTRMKAFIVETCFISNTGDMTKYVNNDSKYIKSIFDFCENEL